MPPLTTVSLTQAQPMPSRVSARCQAEARQAKIHNPHPCEYKQPIDYFPFGAASGVVRFAGSYCGNQV